MNEQISLNGAPVVGFGSTAPAASETFEQLLWYSPLIGLTVGAIGGGYLGRKSRVGPAMSAVAGGVAGTIAAPLLLFTIGSVTSEVNR